MPRKGTAVSTKPENMIRDALNPFDELSCPVEKGTPTSSASVRVPNSLLGMLDHYTHDNKYPWKNRSDFINAAIFRLLEDVQRIEQHPDFDDSLRKLALIHLQLNQEEEGRRLMDASQRIINTVQAVISDNDHAEARRLLLIIRETAQSMLNRRWREKILRIVDAFGELGKAEVNQ